MQSKYGIAAIAVFFAAQNNQGVQALRLQQQLDQLMSDQNALDNGNQAEWGFLKNIVNIDRFFASGDEASPKSAENVQVKDQAKVKSQVHLLAQMKSKSKDSETDEESAAAQTESADGNTEIKEQQQEVAPEAKPEQTATEATQQQETEQQQESKAEDAVKEQVKQEAVQIDESKGTTVTKRTMTAAQAHSSLVRNEGLSVKHAPGEDKVEVDLEIDEENAAAEADEGSQTIKDKVEFQKLQNQLKTARANKANALGEGGFLVELKDPTEFKSKINLVVLPNPQQMEQITVEKFDTSDQKQASTAAQALQIVLGSEAGATIVSDDTPGKESIVKNTNSMYNSEISAGYTIRNNLVQKMAPGDHKFHTVNYQPNNEQNGYRSFPTREEGQKHFDELGEMPRLLISGETGDVLMAHGTVQEINQCLGNFFTQRYKGKYYGQN